MLPGHAAAVGFCQPYLLYNYRARKQMHAKASANECCHVCPSRLPCQKSRLSTDVVIPSAANQSVVLMIRGMFTGCLAISHLPLELICSLARFEY